MNRANRRSQAKQARRQPYAPLREYANRDDQAALRMLQAASQPDESNVTHQLIATHQAWHSLRTGHGSADDWRYLAAITNITRVRSEEIDQLLISIVDDADHSLEAMRRRCEASDLWRVNAQDLRAMPDLITLYEEIAKNSTTLQMHQAAIKAHKRTKNNHSFVLSLSKPNISPA